MSITFFWYRQPTTYIGGSISTPASQPAAVYFTDELGGVRFMTPKPPADGKKNTWKIRVKYDGTTRTYINQEWEFIDDGTTATLRGIAYGSFGFGFWEDYSHEIPSGSDPLDLVSAFEVKESKEDNELHDFDCRTNLAEYEYRIDDVLQAGGFGTSAGLIGIGGFDLRTLSIQNLKVDKPVTDIESENNTVGAKGDIYTLPGPNDSQIYTSGWTPTGDVSYAISILNRDRTATYWSVNDTLTPSAPTSVGKIGSFDLKGPGSPGAWNGKDSNGSGELVLGSHRLEANAYAPHPGNAIASADRRTQYFITYRCPCSKNGGKCLAMPFGSYNPLMHDKEPASLGYGWSSDTDIRVIESGSELILKSGGSHRRWIDDNGTYVPYSPSNYTTAVKDPNSTTARYVLTSRDQTTVQEFDSDGKLKRTLDRNGNATTYTYDGSGFLQSISDQNDNSVHYTRRSDGQPLTMRENDPVTGRLTQYEYYPSSDPDSPDRLKKVIDPEGNETTFIYYSFGPLYSVLDAEGDVASLYTYDDLGRIAVEEMYGELRHVYYYPNNENATQISEVDPLFLVDFRRRKMYFDNLGNTIRIDETLTYPDVRTTLMEYNDPHNPFLLTRTIDPNLAVTETTYTADGKVKTTTDKEGNVTTFVYAEEIDSPLNPKHRDLIREIHRPPVTVKGVRRTYQPTVFEYDSDGNLNKITDAKGQVTSMTHTTDGLVSSVTDARGNTTEFIYEGSPFNGDSRNLLKIRVPKGESPSDGFREIRYAYDDYDNVISVKDDLDNEIVTAYDLLDRVTEVTDALNRETRYVYTDGLLREVILPPNNGSGSLERKVSFLYDASKRLSETRQQINSSGSQEMRVRQDFNIFGEVESLTRLKNGVEKSFRFVYDGVGRLTESTDVLQQTSTIAYEPFCVGQAETTARGIRRKRNYDSRCLLRELETGDVDSGDPLAVQNRRNLYSWEYDELGRLVYTTKSEDVYGEALFGTQRYALLDKMVYDELDRVVLYSRNPKFQYAHDFELEYDEVGNVTKVTEPDGKITEFTYYRDNLLKQVIVKRPSESDRVFTYSYDPAGRLDKIVYPSSTDVEVLFRDEADLTTTGIGTGFDGNGNLRFMRYQKTNGTLIRRFEYTYDPSNNRESCLDVTPSKAIKWEYGYDWFDRLVSVSRAEAATVGGLPTATLQRAYEFDESDNRKFFDDHVNGDTYYYVYESFNDGGTTRYSDQLKEVRIYSSAAGHRTTGDFVLFESFEHDADGNMTKRTLPNTDETDYEWTDFDRLESVKFNQTTTLQEAVYDVSGLRSSKVDKNGNTSYEYSMDIVTSESVPGTGSSLPEISYIQGHTILGAEIDGDFVYHVGDALGTVRDVLDDTGSVQRSFEFDEWGNPLTSSGSGAASPKTWIGGLSVNDDTSDSGLYLMGHRYYSGGVLGRFISRDPIGHRGGMNLYAYGNNNPVNYVDPEGLDTTTSVLYQTVKSAPKTPAAINPATAAIVITAGAAGGSAYMLYELYKVRQSQRQADATARWQQQRIRNGQRYDLGDLDPEGRFKPGTQTQERRSPALKTGGAPGGPQDCRDLLKKCRERFIATCDDITEPDLCMATFQNCMNAVLQGRERYIISSKYW